jgi:hypothetical protein
VFLGSSPSLTGDLGHTAPSDGGNSLLWFSTADGGGDAAGIGEVGFGIFIPEAFANGGHYLTDVFYLGYDDRGAGPDDNHDDYIVRVTVTPTPEPGTWMTMLLGFGAAGMAMRYRRRKTAFAA